MRNQTATFTVRKACPKNAVAWARMRCDLWPKPKSIHREDIRKFFKGLSQEPLEVFFAVAGKSQDTFTCSKQYVE